MTQADSRPPDDPPNPGPTNAASDPALEIPQRVWGGAALQAAGRFWGSGCTALVLVLLARALSGSEFGRLTFYLALFGLLDSWTDFGSSTAVIQRTAHRRAALASALSAGRRMRALTAALGFFTVAGLAWLYQEPGAGWILVAAFYPFTRVAELSGVVHQNALDWRVPVVSRVLAASTRLGLSLALWYAGVREASVYVFAHAVGLSVGNLLLHFFSRSVLPSRSAQALPLRNLFRSALPLGLAAVCQQSYFYADNLFVRHYRGEVEVGHYNAAVRITSLLIMIGAYATSTALPWLARRWHAGQLGPAVALLGRRLVLCAGLLSGLLLPHTEAVLGFLFGTTFENSAAAASSLRWLLGAAFVIHGGGLLLTAVLATGATRSVLLVGVSALAWNLAANAWLVPRLGAVGAAQATLATEIWVTLAAAYLLARSGVALRTALRGWSLSALAFPAAWLLSSATSGFVS